MAEYIIDVKHLQKYYGRHMGIEDVSFSVKKGDVFGFLGSNGSGKSTTIRCLLGLIRASKGEMTLFGGRYKTLTENLKHIGYMPSEAMFYPQMKVKDVIAFAAKSRKKDCSQEADRLCQILEVPLEKKIEDLSLGNRKKVGIVCALQHQPELLILDEPTSGLDPLMQERFFGLVKETCAAGGTCFLSSHVLSDIKNYCNRAAVIKDGTILKVDTLANLTRSQAKQVTVWKDAYQETFTFTGSASELLERLRNMQADDFLVEEPPLEDLFLQYYEEAAK